MWVRGLKLQQNFRQQENYGVAPRVGAWIETAGSSHPLRLSLSHPVWVRGLKLQNGEPVRQKPLVAPRVGAWIETFWLKVVAMEWCVAPRVGAWIETLRPCRYR